MKFARLFQKLCAAVFLFSVMCSAVAAQKPGSMVPRQEKLLNGLKLLIWSDPSADKVSVRIRIHAGSSFDPQGKEGAMKMLAENLFPTQDVRDFYRDELGGSLDVITNYDYIQINATAKSDQFLTLLDSLAS